MHKIPLTPLELEGLTNHRLPIGAPSQLSDAFRHGVAWAMQEVPKLMTDLSECIESNKQAWRICDDVAKALGSYLDHETGSAASIAKLIEDAERYRFIRGDTRKTRRSSTSPYVVNIKRSVLYAVCAYTGAELDAAIDEDRIEDMSQHVYNEAFINGDNRFADPNFRISDEFSEECYAKAITLLKNKGQ